MAGEKQDASLAGNKRDSTGETEGDKSGAVGGDDQNEYELDPEKRREARKMRRIMANRRSARESRERRKKLLTDLQDSVENLTTDNAVLTKENFSLRRELITLVEQSGGVASLSMIPNIQASLESARAFANLADPTAGVISDN
ncbi:unnamed protein product [Pseudo-nitzschia multistriata]|uniref:BZIP domain-containing protein n=1 Tax=Pseudo-nitzschia multistriata TaxID=183589 RepID=A0A448ZBA7_9STRA|nr:unnamed protein product [Pseudo-nitzschia multistriata]